MFRKSVMCLMTMGLLCLLLGAVAAAEVGALQLPTVPAAQEALLNEAANVPGGTLAFVNPDDPLTWPMVPAEEDGFTCLTSTNWGRDDSVAGVDVRVDAQAGDALAFWYKTSCETGFDQLQIFVNGTRTKVFTGEGDWAQYAIAFPEDGSYRVSFRYSKDTVSAAGSDAVYIRDVQLLTGDAARETLAANPVYPVGEEQTLTVASPMAREIAFHDPTFALTALNGLAQYYIVPGDEVQLHVTLTAEDDPDGAVLRAGDVYAVASGVVEDGYAFTFPLTEWSVFTLTPSADSDFMSTRTVVCFPGEAAANRYLEMLQGNGYPVDVWHYVGLTSCAMTVIDQHGEFVEGVEIGLQTWAGTASLVSDSEGSISFAVTPGETAQVRIFSAPAGYTFDPDRVWTLDTENPEVIIDLTRIEE